MPDDDTVVGFVGNRVGPTVKDTEFLVQKLENLVKLAKEGKMTALAYVYTANDKSEATCYDWLCMPGASSQRLHSGTQILNASITMTLMRDAD